MEKKLVTQEDIYRFLEGRDPQERIVNLEYSSRDDFMTVVYRDEEDRKCKHKDPFYPFLWATREACLKLAGTDREHLKFLLRKYSIECKPLDTTNVNGVPVEAAENGYTFMFRAKIPMSYGHFLNFFKEAGNPVYKDRKKGEENASVDDRNDQYLCVTPQQQYLIYSGKRFFKGYDDYNDILRMIFDLETQGLDPKRHRIEWFGIRFNRPVLFTNGERKEFETELRLTGNTEEEKDASELKLIDTALRIIYTFRPDVITAHNGEAFDWNFIIERCTQLGTSIDAVSSKFFNGKSIYKCDRETTLKLGGETEHFRQTVVPGIIITDSLHAVRRAQATDSNFKEAGLKYATKYLKMVKPNRVYIPGDKISELTNDFRDIYAFNDKNGKWYLTDENHPLREEEGYTLVTGHYIVQRYLADDLWECDKVEYALNGTDFMLAKILPVPFGKCVTMGTAGQWKAIMMAWSYENMLAIPKPKDTGKFTGGLSRLLRVGYVKNVVKLDYNSLYPSIILTWAISDDTDLMGAMLEMLEYVLTTREKHKGLKKTAGKTVDKYEEKLNSGLQLSSEEWNEYNVASNTFKVEDNRQASVKKLGNSFFGSYGSNKGSVFPWKSLKCAERTTCTGRMALRLMISHFKKLGYEPIVGDSFTADTPVFIRYIKTGEIDIKPICELIDEDRIEVDALGREYDYSPKRFEILCRSGWVSPTYIYRHKTDKDIYEVCDGETLIEVTEDHSLFNANQEKIRPSEIIDSTELEYFTDNKVFEEGKWLTADMRFPEFYAKELAEGEIDRVPMWFLNRPKIGQEFYDYFMKYQSDKVHYSKTCLAGLQFLRMLK